MQWVYRQVPLPLELHLRALPLERSRWSTGATFKCIFPHVFINALSELWAIFKCLYIYQNSSSGWDSYPAPIDARSNDLPTALSQQLVMSA